METLIKIKFLNHAGYFGGIISQIIEIGMLRDWLHGRFKSLTRREWDELTKDEEVTELAN